MKVNKLLVNAILLSIFFLNSCNKKKYLPEQINETVFYEVIFKDKDNKVKKLRQSYHVLEENNKIVLLKNDGQLVSYELQNEGIKIYATHYTTFNNDESSKIDKKMYLPFPIEQGYQWNEQDKTTLQMKLGYDRIFNTNLPLTMTNQIVGEEYVKLKEGKKIKCLKIEGEGKTSYNPGPPLGNIDISVHTKLWLAEDYGLVKYVREEKSDSATMGEIFYEKNLLIE